MKITVLGSGTFVPEKNRHGPAYLLEADGKNILFDMGRGVMDQLMKIDFNLYSIDKIFVTHTHFDHIAEFLSFFGFILDNPYKKKFRNKYLEVYGPKGFKKSIEGWLKAIQYDKHIHIDLLKIRDIDDREIVKVGKIKIKGFFVPHSEIRNCLAYRVEHRGKIFCFSGDTPKCSEIVEACKNADLAIVDSCLPRKLGLTHVHMCGEDAGEVATKAEVKKLVVTHVADIYFDKVIKDVRKNYKGPAIVSKDLMRLKI